MRSKKSGESSRKSFWRLLRACDGLIEPEVDLVGGVDAPMLLVHSGRQFDLVAVLTLDGLGAGAELGHRCAKGAEVVDHGLIDQDIAIGEIEDAFLAPGLPQTPDDLKGGVGLAGASRHDEQDTVLAFGDGFDGLVDRDALVVARLLAAGVVVVVLQDDFFLRGCQPLPGAVLLPEFVRCREGVEGKSVSILPL